MPTPNRATDALKALKERHRDLQKEFAGIVKSNRNAEAAVLQLQRTITRLEAQLRDLGVTPVTER